MNFNQCIPSSNHHLKQDREQFGHLPKFPLAQWCAGKPALKNKQHNTTKPCLFANFPGVNTPALASFKLLAWQH